MMVTVIPIVDNALSVVFNGKKTGEIENQRKNGDHEDFSIVKIG